MNAFEENPCRHREDVQTLHRIWTENVVTVKPPGHHTTCSMSSWTTRQTHPINIHPSILQFLPHIPLGLGVLLGGGGDGNADAGWCDISAHTRIEDKQKTRRSWSTWREPTHTDSRRKLWPLHILNGNLLSVSTIKVKICKRKWICCWMVTYKYRDERSTSSWMKRALHLI